jgi:hypothetical protein
MAETYGTPDSDRSQGASAAGYYNPDFGAARRSIPLHIVTTARYSAYGQFKVETEETFRPGSPSPPQP